MLLFEQRFFKKDRKTVYFSQFIAFFFFQSYSYKIFALNAPFMSWYILPCLIQHFNKTESVPNSLSAPIILIAFFLPSDVTFVQEFWSQTRVKRERFTAVIDVTRVMSLWLLPRPLLIKQKFLKRFLK